MSCQTSTWASVSGPGADADRRDRNLVRDALGHLAGHHLQHHREGTGLGDRAGVGDHLLRGVAAALHPVPADRVLALRREPDVGHHRDAGRVDRRDLRRAPPAALELHRVAAGLLHEPHGRAQRLGRTLLVRAEGQIADDQRALGRPDHRLSPGAAVPRRSPAAWSRARTRCSRPSRRPAAPRCRPRRRSLRCTGRSWSAWPSARRGPWPRADPGCVPVGSPDRRRATPPLARRSWSATSLSPQVSSRPHRRGPRACLRSSHRRGSGAAARWKMSQPSPRLRRARMFRSQARGSGS